MWLHVEFKSQKDYDSNNFFNYKLFQSYQLMKDYSAEQSSKNKSPEYISDYYNIQK